MTAETAGATAPAAGGQPAETVVHRLRAMVEAGHAGGITHVTADGEEDWQTYADLWEEAERALGGLRAAGARRGDRVLLLLSSGREFLASLWGCLLGGLVPAVLNAPSNLARDSEPGRKLHHVWRLLDRPLLLVPDGAARWFDGPGDVAVAEGPWRRYSEVARGEPARAEDLPVPDDVALLQFSSGSTGIPKGVVLTHANLAASLADMAARMEMTPADTMATWLPDSHDMGLIGTHLMPLWAGSSQLKMAPLTFLRRPRLWLDKMAEHAATVTAAPQFAVDYLLDKVLTVDPSGLDLGSLRLFVNGAEPISPATLREFQRLAGPVGFKESAMFCVYGLAEATLAVTMPTVGESPRTLRVDRAALGRGEAVAAVPDAPPERTLELAVLGRPLASMDVRVVDDADVALPDRQVGHVQVRGPSVTSGYFANADATAALFAGEWMRTGDLGMLDDGELVITGRAKDVIFVKGENVYAHDLERWAMELADLRAGEVAACGFTHPDTGREHVAMFVKARGNPRYDKWLDLRQALFERLGFQVDWILPVASLPKTTSGKLQRRRLAEQLCEGAFDEQVAGWEAAAAERAASRAADSSG